MRGTLYAAMLTAVLTGVLFVGCSEGTPAGGARDGAPPTDAEVSGDASAPVTDASTTDGPDTERDAGALDASPGPRDAEPAEDATALDAETPPEDATTRDAAAPAEDATTLDGGALDGDTDAGAASLDASVDLDASAPDAAPLRRCALCHGSAENAAPPRAISGAVATTDPQVGAHQSHLGARAWHREVTCDQCHIVPDQMTDPLVPTHLDGLTELVFDPIAGQASYDQVAHTCTNYCHGATLRGDFAGRTSVRSPRWTQVDGTQAACGAACHTLPPAEGHPTIAIGCPVCHGDVIAAFDPLDPEASLWTDATKHVDGRVDVIPLGCAGCHGDPSVGDPAPPRGTHGELATSDRAVGAHQAHLAPSTWRRSVECTECHTLPTSVPHADGVVDLALTGLASFDGARPTFDTTAVRCDNVYCHGATLLGPRAGGNVARAPTWTTVDGRFSACGSSCHTNPPAAPHPASSGCPLCHDEVIATYDPGDPTATVWTNASLHVDGIVEVAPLGCTACHGDPATAIPAPPLGTNGESQTTDRAVGAHRIHLASSAWHRPGACTDCHVVPTDSGHANGVVDLTFGGPATTGGTSPAFDGARCSNVYCHGATLAGPGAFGGTIARTPVWTQVNGTWNACGTTCHTNPPGGAHPANRTCELCHSDIAHFDPTSPSSSTWVNAALHADGHVDVNLTCTSCHGDAQTGVVAPPSGVHGETLVSQAAVGAHRAHLGSSSWHRGGACTDCHVVPSSTSHSNGAVDLPFGALASTDGALPSYDRTTVTCTNVYCHGSTLLGASSGGTVARSPAWTSASGAFDACGTSCHTNPPGGTHPADARCAVCHGAVIASYDPANPAAATWTNAELHVDGIVEVVTLGCTTCHGDPAANDPSPPVGTHGETLTSQRAVGAHAQHLGSSAWHREGRCEDCHVVPTSPLHANGVVGLTFGAPASSDGATPSFDTTALTCSGAYCHGATLQGVGPFGGSLARTPIWTQVNGTFDGCGTSCHTNPPGGLHPASQRCELCHDTIARFDAANPSASLWASASRHVDGVVDLSLTCVSCHGDQATNDPAPPRGTHDQVSTTAPEVGAHRAHLAGGSWHQSIACGDCHVVPASVSDPAAPGHMNGLADLTAEAGTYDRTAHTCSNYCHGATLRADPSGQASNKQPLWTAVDGTQDACGTACHALPPGGGHPPATGCPSCHGAVIASFDPASPGSTLWVDGTKHVNGQVEVVGLTCTTCHGDATTNDPAPPRGTRGELLTNQRAVGAHQQHLDPSAWHRPGVCRDCHVVPTANEHANAAVELSFGSVATTNGAAPAFSGTTLRCAGTYCHGSTLGPARTGGAISRSPIWTTVNGSFDACGTTCHTNPPGGTHPNNTRCQTCHGAVIASYNTTTPSASTWANAALHVDGIVQVVPMTCTTCHGNAITNNPAPPLGTGGETVTTQRAVGAHAQHLGVSTWHRPGDCTDCHVVPAPTNMSHANGSVGITFGALASDSGATPVYSASALTCAGTYCHGATLPGVGAFGGAVARTPLWTQVNNTWDACGTSCHTNPPGGTHPASQACVLCHGDVIASFDPANPSATTWTAPARHVDGVIDVRMTCVSCHGSVATNDPAPPRGTGGQTLTTAPQVGAHQAHLAGSAWHRRVTCEECHVVPTAIGDPAFPTHMNGIADLTWGPVARVGAYDRVAHTCSSYCHGSTLRADISGQTANRAPRWTQVDNTQDACGTSCHTLPPGGGHPPVTTGCPLCHGEVIASFDPGNLAATQWTDAAKHVDGIVETVGLTCTTCHGNPATNDPAPPHGARGETLTSQAAVGAHQAHLGASTWHRNGACADCHVVPTVNEHANAVVDVRFGDLAGTNGTLPAFDFTTASCNDVYCHGATLLGARPGGTLARSPIWTTVNGTYDACGQTCHTNPPAAPHTTNARCPICHDEVIATYDPANPSATTWANAALHVDGLVEVAPQTCTGCHGDAATNNPAPPAGTNGETLTTQRAVGAHAQHLNAAAWHRQGQCQDCHVVPTDFGHADGVVGLTFGAPAINDGAAPAFDGAGVSCSGVYCHGATLAGVGPFGGAIARTPVWTQVNNTWDTCGQTCHTLPPGGVHPTSRACETCHAPIAHFDPAVPSASAWVSPSLHVDGKIDLRTLTCTSCHGNTATNDPSPPTGTHGETLTTERAVGAHQAHLASASWHHAVACTDCHVVPASNTHANGTVGVTFSGTAIAGSASPSWNGTTCAGTYCHGATLLGAAAGGSVARTPSWTQVNGSWAACGTTCHTNPPGGSHPAGTTCGTCHAAVVASYDAVNRTATWANSALHIDGVVQATGYHDLPSWTSPPGNTNHHGSRYFLTNRQRDEHDAPCSSCHGADLLGGTVGVSCNNTSCHGTDFRSCTFCHGTTPGQINPPAGVGGETSRSTLAVGDHVQHVAASPTHVAIACATCHIVPATNDVGHAIDYAPSTSLATVGHHGDVTITTAAGAMTWNVNATSGNPISARGTCTGGCHSNGRGGAPRVVPYWAGGAWTPGSCDGCHDAQPTTGGHGAHADGFACTDCHPGADTATHLNGVRDRAPPPGFVIQVGLGPCGTRIGCSGNCHAEAHPSGSRSRCW